jgi:hypothetical protein
MRFSAMAVLLVAAVVALWTDAVPMAAEPRQGAAEMVLEGGRQGPVPFPHHRHQAALGDCTVCHTVFAQEPGSIERLKAAGTLKAQSDVMNKLCVKCHRAERKAGGRSGPVTCTACHQK